MAIIENPNELADACFILQKRDMLVRADGKTLSSADMETFKPLAKDFIQETENGFCAMELMPDATLPAGYELKTIRQSFAELQGEDNFRLARARALLTWHAGNRFCACCGSPLQLSADLSAKVCSGCGKQLFPRIEPCIIVLVNKGDKILLARHAGRNQDVYSCLAGFIEVGETAEHAVEREIFEEVGIRVKNVRYRGSQSWPFPDQLMMAYTAEYESGEFKFQEGEIADAGWFDRDSCPATPKPGSIAYKLIHQEI